MSPNEEERRGRMSTLVAQSKDNAGDWRERSKLTKFAREYIVPALAIGALLSGALALVIFAYGITVLLAVM